GGVYTINGSKAKEVVAQLKPRMYILPMHYGTRTFEDLLPPDEFLEGQKNVQRMLTTNELTIRTAFHPPAPVIVLLGWEKGGRWGGGRMAARRRPPGDPDNRQAVRTEEQVSAGGVVARRVRGREQVALICVGPQRRWQLPKGLVEPGEAPEAAAAR